MYRLPLPWTDSHSKWLHHVHVLYEIEHLFFKTVDKTAHAHQHNLTPDGTTIYHIHIALNCFILKYLECTIFIMYTVEWYQNKQLSYHEFVSFRT